MEERSKKLVKYFSSSYLKGIDRLMALVMNGKNNFAFIYGF